ncbi:MAG: exodeoxyribonuclease III [Deltaproteobacteria bacterium]|nr:exodeoxyribonuclease III [Deltaproteobacteria bacterium]
MRVVSWNVNGLRAIAKKGFSRWLRGSGAALAAVQEVRARHDQLPASLARPRGLSFHLAAAERPGYSGVGLYAARGYAPDHVETALGEPHLDAEGRFLLARVGRLTVVSAYFPNGNGKDRDNSRIPYKLDFYRAVFDRLEAARAAGEPVLVMGDFNTSPEDIDLARPRSNQKTSGFTPPERADFRRHLARGWVDTFRHRHPDAAGRYTWWSQRKGVREKNVGWRLDFVLASPGAMPFVRDAFIEDHVLGSDHCPVGVVLDPAVLGREETSS